MSVKEQLQIILITYNREKQLQTTLSALTASNSPVKTFDITILDNCSTDGTPDLCREFVQAHSNFTYIRNKINVGISGNIIKAMEMANKKWLWVICDDDAFDWSAWSEIETALGGDEYDIVHTTYTAGFRNETYPYLINEEACIYNTRNIDSVTMQNAYAMAYTLLPHHAIGCKVINKGGKIFVPQKRLVRQRYEDKLNFVRMPRAELFHRLDNYQLLGGYIQSYALINDKKMRRQCVDVMCLGFSFKKSMYWFVSALPQGDLPAFLDVLAVCDKKQRQELIKQACLHGSAELQHNLHQVAAVLSSSFNSVSRARCFWQYYRACFLFKITKGKKKEHYRERMLKFKKLLDLYSSAK